LRPEQRIIFALDLPDFEEAVKYIDILQYKTGIFKVGLELFIKDGRRVIDYIHENTKNEIFLDLKLLDIPKTVERSVAIVKSLGVRFLTVHAMDRKTLEYAVAAAVEKLNILGVTLLTSFDWEDLKEHGLKDEFVADPSLIVKKRAGIAKDAGCSGIICSPHEVLSIKNEIGKDFLCITPGVRMKENDKGDQKRTATPYEAIKNGSDYIVVGRPLRDAKDPVKAAEKISEEINMASKA